MACAKNCLSLSQSSKKELLILCFKDKENIDVFTSNREPEGKQPEAKPKSSTNSNIFLEMLEKANEEKASKNM